MPEISNNNLSLMSNKTDNESKNGFSNFLECPICTENLLPPIFNCINGHSICNDCRPKIDKCSICKDKLTKNRSITLESIVSNSTFECRFSTDGCTKEFKGDLLAEHHQVCNFRSVICNEKFKNKCFGINVPYKSYIEHLEKAHGCISFKNYDEQFEISESFDKDQLLKAGLKWEPLPVMKKLMKNGIEKKYFYRSEIRNGLIYWWLSAFEPIDETQYVSFRLCREDSNFPMIEWKSQIFSCRDTFDDIKHLIFLKLPIKSLLPFTNSKSLNCETKVVWNICGKIEKIDK